MAGSPLKRQRKLGVRNEDGSVIAFPYMPRVAELPSGWRHWSRAEKIEHLLGMSLYRAYEILSGPTAELDPFRLSVQMQVLRIVFIDQRQGAARWHARPRGLLASGIARRRSNASRQH